MSLMCQLMGWIAKLPPVETHEVVVEKDLEVPMPDGVILLADHYAPRNLGSRLTLLMRSVDTGRTLAGWTGELWAARGFHVLLQSGRGVAGSGGTLDPFRQEYEDGKAVMAWLKHQEWFNGQLAVCGASYLGFTAWARARAAGSLVKALSTQLTGSSAYRWLYPGEAFSLEFGLSWMTVLCTQEGSLLSYIANVLSQRKRRAGLLHLPLAEADQVVVSKSVPFWRIWLAHEQPNDAWWRSRDHSGAVAEVTAPNHLVGGRYDVFLPQLISDYLKLEQAGRRQYLTIGPWTHTEVGTSTTGMCEAIIWLRAHLLGDRRVLRAAPVRLFVMGAEVWRDFSTFPPPAVSLQRWYLQPEGGLDAALPPECPPDHYHYDPSDPKLSVGGAGRYLQGRGSQDNRSLEARPDVLTYTSAVLDHDREIIGPVTAELWPTAYRFRRRHRIRLQVSSGSFPRWNHHLGSSEKLTTATKMREASQQVYHDPDHPSAVALPIVDERKADQEPEAR
jgi:uncharacterized protein